MRGMCKLDHCPLKHITGEEAKNRGLPPIVRLNTQIDSIMHPTIENPEIPIPEEEEPDFETKTLNRLPSYDEPEMFYTTFDSIE